MALKNIVVLVGGVGGAKLALGLVRILPPESLTVIVNTGDDFWHYGLRICPDLDTIMYTLSDLVNRDNGWGVVDDSRNMLDMMQRYGEEPWFGLGDRDLATHLLRTRLLREGYLLTGITKKLTTALGVKHRVLPMTDAPVETMVDTVEYGELDFQTYFVRYRWQPTVKALRFDDCENAAMTISVQEALASADVILIAPSNPWLSIAPILSIPGMRETIVGRDVPRVAITPIIGGRAIKGPTAKLMSELGYEVNAQTVAEYYGDLIDSFVYDEQDIGLEIKEIRTIAMNTIMNTESDKSALAQNVLNWIEKGS